MAEFYLYKGWSSHGVPIPGAIFRDLALHIAANIFRLSWPESWAILKITVLEFHPV